MLNHKFADLPVGSDFIFKGEPERGIFYKRRQDPEKNAWAMDQDGEVIDTISVSPSEEVIWLFETKEFQEVTSWLNKLAVNGFRVECHYGLVEVGFSMSRFQNQLKYRGETLIDCFQKALIDKPRVEAQFTLRNP